MNHPEDREVIEVQVTNRAGSELRIAAKPGVSLMEALRDNGVDDVLALCGGCCSCGTCHVYVEGSGAASTAISPGEDDLLDSSAHRRANSRLACQLILAIEHDGMMIRIAPED